ncbi:MAG: transposase [Oribacterium sp.]|nr:transposase [Oribacterium sp.]
MYSEEFWEHLIKLHIEEGRTYKSIAEEFGVHPEQVGRRVRLFRALAERDAARSETLSNMEEIRRLQEELAEVKKENDFLKKLAAFYAKETQ